jgi:hypothetical protein
MKTNPIKYLLAAALALVLVAGPAAGQDDPGLDDLLEGFDEQPPAAEDGSVDRLLEGFDAAGPAPAEDPEPEEEPARSWLSVHGDLSLLGSVNFGHEAPGPRQTDHRGLSRLRPRLRLDLEADLPSDWQIEFTGHAWYDFVYDIKGRDDFTQDVLDKYLYEIEADQAFLEGRLSDSVDLKVGRQVMVWGKADNIRVVDVLNPLDNREPGLVDIRDLKLPVTAAKLDVYFGPWDLSLIAIPELRYNKDPAFGSDFYPFDRPLPPVEEPSAGWGRWEAAAALKGIFSGWDLSYFAAYYYDDLAHIEPHGPAGLKRVHSRITMVGAAANVALGNWLLKTEAALLHGLEYHWLPGAKKNRLDFLIGAEYTGLTDTTISLELADRWLMRFDPVLERAPDSAEEHDFQAALRVTRTFLHDRLELTALVSSFGVFGENGAFQRIQAVYDWTDHWETTLGVVLYQAGDKALFQNIELNDRVFFEVKYGF